MASPNDEAINYEVILSDVAEADKDAAYLWQSVNRSSELAQRWYQEFRRALGTLSLFPNSGAIAPDNDAYDVEVRQTTFGKGSHRYRILYHVLEEDRLIRILRIRHTAQRLLTDDQEEP